MKCANCGFETEQTFTYCPGCGTPAQPTEPVQPEPMLSLNPAADKAFSALRDNLFLAVCILISISCGLSIISGSFPLLHILSTIFLWIAFSKARKGIVDTEQLRCISGTVYAGYIINYVLFGLFFLIGISFEFVFGIIGSTSYHIDELIPELDILGELPYNYDEAFISVLGVIIMIVFTVVAAIGIIINALGMRSIHRFLKSLYQGVQTCNPYFAKVNAAKNWLMFFGICSAITCVSSLFTVNFLAALSEGCTAAALIVSSVLIKKHFS